ncbi:mandelate racemase [Halobacteria archaeon AArc-m2/3/4]|uniref:glucarate dehydratase n=1 Tax=Natronoglomus mannanivorans TaxID=2979990 RepID=A0AAP3E589_9EURY|nr:mandelate racemase [Halobacteria archaeon AArc-xg1-1]MCU4973561.1 mandelate racemase [Halobacteria archaeon AArc-m2/3/4]
MEISELEFHWFEDEIDDIGTRPDGEAVYDPGSTATHSGFVLVIRTDTGLEGYCRSTFYAKQVAAQIEEAAGTFLLGRDPLEREEIWWNLRRILRHSGHMGLGPIDIALWDLAGKHYGASVAELLGGRRRERIPAYASTMSGNPELDTPETYADFAEECLEQGYPAFKLHPLGEPDRDIEACRAVADRVGDEMDLMLDPSSTYQSYTDALRVGRVLDELEFTWYEDPLRETGDSIYAMRRLAAELDTPLLGLEHSRTEPFGLFNHLEQDALDIARVDALLGGGITGALKAVHTAETAGIDVEPHLGGPEHLQLLATITNATYFEHGLLHPHVDLSQTNSWGYTEQIDRVEDGHVTVPDGPGMGVEIDWDWLDEHGTETTVVE